MMFILTILTILSGFGVGYLFGGVRYNSGRTFKDLKEKVILLVNEQEQIKSNIQRGKFEGKKLAERNDVLRLYNCKIQCYIYCLQKLRYDKEIDELWEKIEDNYSDSYDEVFKTKRYCKHCKSLY